MVPDTKSHSSVIDLMKMLCALLVVGIHTEPFSFSFLLNNAFGLLTRIAVPFFFIASSYLFYSKPFAAKQFRKYIQRIFVLYSIWFVIYALSDCFFFAAPISKQTFFDFFIYGYKHFWHLHANITAIGLFALLLHLFKRSCLIPYAIVCLLYIWGTLNSTYSNLLSLKDPVIRILGTRNGIYYAPVFIMIGHLFAHSDKMMSAKKSALSTAFMFGILAAESGLGVLVFKAPSTILWFSTPALMYMLFSFIMTIRISLPPHLSLLLRKLSIGIYCIHYLLVFLLLPHFGYGIPLFFAVLLLSTVISLILYASSAKLRLLRYFL